MLRMNIPAGLLGRLSIRRCSREALFILVGGLVLVGDVGRLNGQTENSRQFFPSRPVLERTIGEDDDIVLYRPTGIIALSTDLLAVFDWSEMQIRTFSSKTGRQRWTFGHRGSGPQEFAGGHDLAVSPVGELSVLDKANNRVTRVSQSGRFISSEKLPESVRQLLPPMRGSNLVVIPEDTVHLWEALDRAGEVVASMRLPRTVHYSSNLAGESYVASFPEGLAVAFRWSDVLVLLDSNGAVRQVVRGPERIEFPEVRTYSLDPSRIKLEDPKVKITSVTGTRIAPRSTEAVRAVAGAGGKLFVLFSGAGPQSGRLVDQYNIATGTYEGTHLLPSAAIDIAALDGKRVATIESDMIPVVRIWRLPTDARATSVTRSRK